MQTWFQGIYYRIDMSAGQLAVGPKVTVRLVLTRVENRPLSPSSTAQMLALAFSDATLPIPLPPPAGSSHAFVICRAFFADEVCRLRDNRPLAVGKHPEVFSSQNYLATCLPQPEYFLQARGAGKALLASGEQNAYSEVTIYLSGTRIYHTPLCILPPSPGMSSPRTGVGSLALLPYVNSSEAYERVTRTRW